MDMKLEVITIPVTDVERATEFYRKLGWRQDVTPPGSGIVQFTPPGPACSVQFGSNRTTAAPGSAQNNFLIVTDVQVVHDELLSRGIDVDDVYHLGANGPADGVDPEHHSYLSYASFADPDGNRWLFQEVTTRLAGRIDSGETSYGSESDLADAMRRAESAHGEHEKRTGERDEKWPDWYAAYMAAEQSGAELPV
jgi:catechol 2,3-dioxygenase-like lactoylglutathione lyase family enzyme